MISRCDMDCLLVNGTVFRQLVGPYTEPLVFVGALGAQVVSVMVDSGASLNFISTALVARLGWPPVVGQVARYVTTASGVVRRCDQYYRNVHVTIQHLRFSVDVYAMESSEKDIMFGMPWFQSMRPVLLHFKE